MPESEQVTGLIDSFRADPNAVRIKKLLYCASYDAWPTDLAELDECSWFVLVQEILDKATDLDRLQNALISVVSHLNKKNVYFMLARSLFNRLKVLYPDYHGDLTSMGNRFAQVRKLLDKSEDLFSLRLRISHSSSLKKAKSIVFSAISCRFEYTTPDVNYLNQNEFDDLVRELLYASNSIEDLRFRIFGAASCLDDCESNLKVATLLCGTIASLYPTLDPTATPALSGNASLDDFDRMSAGNSALFSFDVYESFDTDDVTSALGLVSDIAMATPMLPRTGTPRPGLAPSSRETLGSPLQNEVGDDGSAQSAVWKDVQRDIQSCADRYLNETVAAMESNLKALSDYIDRQSVPSSFSANQYKHRVLHEFVEGLQASCQTQLARLDRLLDTHMEDPVDRDGASELDQGI